MDKVIKLQAKVTLLWVFSRLLSWINGTKLLNGSHITSTKVTKYMYKFY